ncbi:MAG TPA: tRNA (adenosine(37)-N6)-threonylcarbamoyltransferase complex transferase subunit TsaD [Bacilli bacterium]|nr:tRNA (adenosine(37)-N6)-threonylcarbamoyltransferase complex transferase subunit TsaD [Bacilli bacterium]HPK86186.1 tRNA (adenosine(37)-N6)-threonylcarbamoyltransferase complex transferase subunit TsaD [Bacilli bacterium]
MSEERKERRLLVREMELKDIPTILTISEESFLKPWTEEQLRRELDDKTSPFSYSFVLEYGEIIIGFINFWLTFESATINLIAIRSFVKRHGLGSLLLQDALTRIRQIGTIQTVTLEVRTHNEEAINFYQKHGFNILLTKRAYYDNGDDAFYMIKIMKESTRTILAIESSCDETSVAITRNGKLLSNVVATQIDMHQKYGGVMPEMASRLHTENITIVLKEALEKAKITLDEVDAFAVTRGPGLIGALHVGLQAAKTLALIYKKPLIPVHHLAAHIYANEFVKELKFPLIALVVSGGNTELVYMRGHFNFEIIGQTKDDAVGECYDKVARVLCLGYPGGVPIDKLARKGKHSYTLPTPALQNSYDFSYSGLKTHVINLINNTKQRGESIIVEDLCTSFQETAIDALVNKTKKAFEEFEIKQIVLAGGVSANSYLREMILELAEEKNVDAIVPPLWCTTDQAAMIAKTAEYLYDLQLFAPLSLGVDPNWRIEEFDKFNIN